MTQRDLETTIVRAIAANLTESQRSALLWLPGDGGWREEEKGRLVMSLRYLTARKVCDRVTAELVGHSNPKWVGRGWAPYSWRATPLGLKVRAVVAGEREADGG